MEYIFSGKVNKDQLDKLSELCFTLAKGAFAFVVCPAEKRFEDPMMEIVKTTILLVMGLAFIHIGLVLLKLKEIVK